MVARRPTKGVEPMRTRREIEDRMVREDDPFTVEVLRWVLDGGCPMCKHNDRKEYEIQIHTEEIGPHFLEVKHGWAEGTIMEHMENHIDYDPSEAEHIEDARRQSINTLDAAEDIVFRIRGYLDELEEEKEASGDGITSEFVADAARLIAQANSSLKLVGQLKKEIGVDSQLLLAEARLNQMNRILVDTLIEQPELLDRIENKMRLLNEPNIIDAKFKVVE